MMEVGVVIDKKGEPIHWHLPTDRTGGALPETYGEKSLWAIIWENRERLGGIAHSHPGSGMPGPSYEDVTTFAALESALGVRLRWWITSETDMVVARWVGPHRLSYMARALDFDPEPEWANELRRQSGQPSK